MIKDENKMPCPRFSFEVQFDVNCSSNCAMYWLGLDENLLMRRADSDVCSPLI